MHDVMLEDLVSKVIRGTCTHRDVVEITVHTMRNLATELETRGFKLIKHAEYDLGRRVMELGISIFQAATADAAGEFHQTETDNA